MLWGRMLMLGAAVAALVMLPGCGKRFPFGERLLPESYGPPFGSALKDNLPEHPHNPASEERHAAADAEENRIYASHAACNAAMRAVFARHAADHDGAGHGSGAHGGTGAVSGGDHGSANPADHAPDHGENPHGPVQISSVESVGHYTAGDVIHEYRCSDYTLSHRSWHAAGAHGGQQSH